MLDRGKAQESKVANIRVKKKRLFFLIGPFFEVETYFSFIIAVISLNTVVPNTLCMFCY